MLNWDDCTFLIWRFQGLKDVTILGRMLTNFQTPNLKSKHRAGAQSTVLLLETQQWNCALGDQEEGPLVSYTASQVWAPTGLLGQ